MPNDELVQKNLFGNDTNLVTISDDNFEEKDLTNESLTKDSQVRPRERKRPKT